ncbi:hypothetical protein RSAG8_11106, partial [Rhizoctonia solani AG-8 WAC10335]
MIRTKVHMSILFRPQEYPGLAGIEEASKIGRRSSPAFGFKGEHLWGLSGWSRYHCDILQWVCKCIKLPFFQL